MLPMFNQSPFPFRSLAVPILMAAALAGCATPDRLSTATGYPEDFRARHPIVLNETQKSLDIFPTSTGLGRSNQLRVQSFAADYIADANGPIVIQVPAASPGRGGNHLVVDQIRAELHRSGVKGYVQVGSYVPANPVQAAPVRVSYVGLGARVAGPCGEWPRDLASGSSMEGWENKAYWNLGCATQNTLAAQVADPRDLANPRGETPSDVAMRTRAITKVRMGDDPSTKWQVRNTAIGTVGGGN